MASTSDRVSISRLDPDLRFVALILIGGQNTPSPANRVGGDESTPTEQVVKFPRWLVHDAKVAQMTKESLGLQDILPKEYTNVQEVMEDNHPLQEKISKGVLG